jgi:hypothetical protein
VNGSACPLCGAVLAVAHQAHTCRGDVLLDMRVRFACVALEGLLGGNIAEGDTSARRPDESIEAYWSRVAWDYADTMTAELIARHGAPPIPTTLERCARRIPTARAPLPTLPEQPVTAAPPAAPDEPPPRKPTR